jgi:hypothetical protein
MQTTPCLHLVTFADGAGCHIGRAFPEECHGCAAYVAGINEEERRRCEAWTAAARCPNCYDSGDE